MDHQEIPRTDAPIPETPETPAEQPAFENVSALGYEEYLQCYKKIRFYGAKIKIWLVAVALYLAGVLLARETLSVTWIMIPYVIVAGLLVYVLLFAPRKQAKVTTGRIMELYGRIPEIRAFFFQDRIVFHNTASNGDLTLRYESIANCMETRDVILLMTKQKQFHPLAKAGFSGTDEAGFKAFMREKLPGDKLRW